MKTLFLFFLLLFLSFQCDGQGREPQLCKLDTSEILELTCYLYSQNDTVKYRYSVDYSYQCYRSYDSYKIPTQDSFYIEVYTTNCDPFICEFNEKTGETLLSSHPYIGSNRYESEKIPLDWSKVRSINFDFDFHFEIDKKDAVDLSKIPILNSIDKIELDSISVMNLYDYRIRMNLSKWKIYDQLCESNTLVSIKYDVYNPLEEDLLEEFKPFTNLKELAVSKKWNDELLNFPKLESVTLGSIDVFSIQAMEKLQFLNKYNWSISKGGNYSYLMQTLLLERLGTRIDLIHGANYYGDLYINPLMISDAYIIKNRKSKKLKSQEMVFLAIDHVPLIDNFDYFREDTIASGRIKKGKKIGVWKYKLYFPTEHYGDDFYVNHSEQKELIVPENGKWEHHYANGNLACTGVFKDQLRDSIWKVYSYDGSLKSVWDYTSDIQLWSKERTYIQEKFGERRVCRLDDGSYLYVIYYDQEINLSKATEPISGCKYDNVTGDLYSIKEDLTGYDLIERGSDEYDTILFEHFIKKLFPEFEKGKQIIRIKFETGCVDLFD